MRLLALRGRDLASLAGPFEVDLQASVLGGAGIFAITGPTGAGKSTLLDAICLALFDAAPRLAGAEKGAGIGVDGLQADSTRTLLRHGAASAMAEVDFIGQDRRAYRATWQVRRAHGKAGGKLQDSAVSLRDLTGGGLLLGDGKRKKDTLDLIAARVGLSFDQFRRAVLLAQGDFEAFIKARSAERAELLERITGADIYSRLSIAAHQRKAGHEAARKEIERQLGDHPPLDPDVRAAAEAELAEARGRLAALDTERRLLARVQDWHAALAALETRASEADTASIAATRRDWDAEPDRAELARVRRALALHPALAASAEAAQRLAASTAEIGRADHEVLEVGTVLDRARGARAEAGAALAEAEAASVAAAPDLHRARALDAQLAAKEADATARAAEAAQATQAHDAATAEVDSIAEARERADAAVEEHLAWLRCRDGHGVVATRLPEIVDHLTDWAALRHAADGFAAECGRVRAAAEAHAAEHGAAAAPAAALAEQEQDLAVDADRLRAARGAFDRAAGETARDRAEAEAQAALSALAAAETAARAAGKRDAALEDAAAQEMRATQAAVTAADAGREAERDRARLEEARPSLDWLEAAASDAAAHLRAALAPGEPCPVCGGTEHAVAADAALRAKLAEQRGRVAALQAAMTAAEARSAGYIAEAAAASEAAERARGSAAILEEERRAAHADWRAARARSRLDMLPEAPDPLAASAAQEAARARMAELARALREDQDRQDAVVRLAVQRDGVRQRRDALAASLARLDAARRDALAEAAALEQRRVGADADAARCGTRLDGWIGAVLPDWRTRRSGDADAACRAMAEAWTACLASRDAAVLLHAQLVQQAAAADANVAALADARGLTASRADAARDDAGRLRALRAEVLDGRDAGAVEAELDGAMEACRAVQRAAEQQLGAAEVRQGAAAARLDAAHRAAVAAERHAGLAEAALASALAAADLDRAEAEATVATRGENWADAEARRLDSLSADATAAALLVRERRDAVARHRATDSPGLDAEAVAVRLAAIEPEHAAAEAAHTGAAMAIRQDDAARTRRAGLAAELDRCNAAGAVWEQLGELIGHHRGDTFRRYAQSLTLDHLVALANWHLRDLHPRYRLERVAGGEMHLQVVDTQMADEVRPLGNLSGGERFLASLALALGLSSLQSREGLRIESLFIDEGFGTLDSASLGAAISALEALQATGRQVGVISHVAEVQERIAAKVSVVPQGGGRSRVDVRFG